MDLDKNATIYWGEKTVRAESMYQSRYKRLNPDTEFNDLDREWRRKFNRAQNLTINDGALDLYQNPDYRKIRFNIFRRIGRTPMDMFEFKFLPKLFGKENWRLNKAVRQGLATTAACLGIVYYFAYYSQYKANDWTRKTGWKVFIGKPHIYPNSSEFPEAPSYTRTRKDEYAVENLKDHHWMKIGTSTPLRYMDSTSDLNPKLPQNEILKDRQNY